MAYDIPENYVIIIEGLKKKIRESRLRAVSTLNAEMLFLYWEIGKVIADQEAEKGWGKKVVELISKDLKSEFSDVKGFSPRNLRYMRDFYFAYPGFSILHEGLAKSVSIIEPNKILQEPLAKLTWYHHITLLDKVKDIDERKFYIEQTVENGWSRNTMVHQIESKLYRRKGQLLNNFSRTINLKQSELVQQIFKDPYKFDFIGSGEIAREKDLENALIRQLKDFLIELGQWFAFMGQQYKVTLGEKEYFFDLLFYHTRLKRYIIIELKIDEFKPEYKGKMEYYLTIADEQLKTETDEESIGLILCKTKDGLVAEYALRDSNKPIGIAEYKLNELLPENIKGELPTIEEIETEIEKGYEELKSSTQKRLDSLKAKLAVVSHENEIKQRVNVKIIQDLFKYSLKDLFDIMLTKFEELHEYFYSVDYKWTGLLACINDIEQIAQDWRDESFANSITSSQFQYQFEGFKKAGVSGFNIFFQLTLEISAYWYGFSIPGTNKGTFLKKLYHEQLTKDDKKMICETAIDFIVEMIEQQYSYIEQGNN